MNHVNWVTWDHIPHCACQSKQRDAHKERERERVEERKRGHVAILRIRRVGRFIRISKHTENRMAIAVNKRVCMEHPQLGKHWRVSIRAQEDDKWADPAPAAPVMPSADNWMPMLPLAVLVIYAIVCFLRHSSRVECRLSLTNATNCYSSRSRWPNTRGIRGIPLSTCAPALTAVTCSKSLAPVP